MEFVGPGPVCLGQALSAEKGVQCCGKKECRVEWFPLELFASRATRLFLKLLPSMLKSCKYCISGAIQ